MTPRDHVHQLVDELKDDQLARVEQYIATVIEEEDPVLRTLMGAEIDDEPLTPQEMASIRASEEDIKHGRIISLDEAEKRLLGR